MARRSASSTSARCSTCARAALPLDAGAAPADRGVLPRSRCESHRRSPALRCACSRRAARARACGDSEDAVNARPHDPCARRSTCSASARDFPLLARRSTASRWSISTTRTRRRSRTSVIEAVDDFYRESQRERRARRAHARRGSDRRAYEATRDKLARFINAPSRDEIVLHQRHDAGDQSRRVQLSRCRACEPGDEILVTTMEHHANIVPWQLARRPHRREAQGRADHRERRARSSRSSSSC